VIDQRYALAPGRTVRPRHRATQRSGALTVAIRELGYSRPERGRNGARTSAGAVACGLAAASIGVLVTVLIATGGRSVPEMPLVAKAPNLTRSSVAILPLPLPGPRHVDRTHATARPRHTSVHRASAPPAGLVTSPQVNTASRPSSSSHSSRSSSASPSSFVGSGISFWLQLAERLGMTNWRPNTDPSDTYPWP
jgi:hypothetical protein